MKYLFLLLFTTALGAGANPNESTTTVKITGIVKKLDGDAVVLRVKDGNIRISKRFFEEYNQLSVGEVASAHYPMTFNRAQDRTPLSD